MGRPPPPPMCAPPNLVAAGLVDSPWQLVELLWLLLAESVSLSRPESQYCPSSLPSLMDEHDDRKNRITWCSGVVLAADIGPLSLLPLVVAGPRRWAGLTCWYPPDCSENTTLPWGLLRRPVHKLLLLNDDDDDDSAITASEGCCGRIGLGLGKLSSKHLDACDMEEDNDDNDTIVDPVAGIGPSRVGSVIFWEGSGRELFGSRSGSAAAASIGGHGSLVRLASAMTTPMVDIFFSENAYPTTTTGLSLSHPRKLVNDVLCEVKSM
jgi:hypothetical protein